MELQRRLPDYAAPSHTSPNAAYFYQPDAFAAQGGLQRRRTEPQIQPNDYFAINRQSDTFHSPQPQQIHQTGVLPSSWVTDFRDTATARLSVSPLAKYQQPICMLIFLCFLSILSHALSQLSLSRTPRKIPHNFTFPHYLRLNALPKAGCTGQKRQGKV